MKWLLIPIMLLVSAGIFAQDDKSKIHATERAFEKMVAEKGMNEAFVEYLAKNSVMFMPDAVDAPKVWRERKPTPAVLTWNAILLDTSKNGVLGYSIGNSRFRPNGKDDPTVYYGHYLSVWMRQPNGEYRAVLDTGINHDKPASEPVEWKSPTDSDPEGNAKKISAADSAVGFYEGLRTATTASMYKKYLADDVIMLREGKLPAFGKKAALEVVKESGSIFFSGRKAFTEAADLGYVTSMYSLHDERRKETERGNFVQVWKFRKGKWQIVADVLIPLPAAK